MAQKDNPRFPRNTAMRQTREVGGRNYPNDMPDLHQPADAKGPTEEPLILETTKPTPAEENRPTPPETSRPGLGKPTEAPIKQHRERKTHSEGLYKNK